MGREKWKPASCDFIQFVRWAVKVTLNLLIIGIKNTSYGGVEAVSKARVVLQRHPVRMARPHKHAPPTPSRWSSIITHA